MSDPMQLWDLLRAGAVEVEVWCNACHHHAALPTRRLIDRFGTAFPVPEIAQKCRCTRCGSRDVQSRPAWAAEGPGVVTRHATDRSPPSSDPT